MARPHKEGMEFYAFDVNMGDDDKVFYIHAKHGIVGKACYVFLLCRVYKNGYYYPWTEREQIIFASKEKLDIDVCINIVNDCIKEGLFSSEMYDKYKILTSAGIQKRYVYGSERRKQLKFIGNYLLINPTDFQSDYQKEHQKVVIDTLKDINVCNNSVNVDINSSKCDVDVYIEDTSCIHQEELTPVKGDFSTQRREEERREEERREEERREEKKGDTPLIPLALLKTSGLTKVEEELITVLSSVKGYKVDIETDKTLFHMLERAYPKIDIIETVKDWATGKLDNPIKPKAKPRSEIRNYVKKDAEFGKNLRKGGAYGEVGHGLSGESDPFAKGLFKPDEAKDYSDEGML